jgi:uncharacterized membrane protein YiaA
MRLCDAANPPRIVPPPPMSHSQIRVFRPASPAYRAAIAAASVVLLCAALAVVLFATMRTPLKDDIAWLLYVARRWMAGRALYVDVVEVNPPLIVWISAIPIQIGSWFGVDPQRIAMPFFIAAVMGCAWWSAVLLKARGGMFADRVPVFAVIGTVLLVVPAGDLGQREHLLVAATLPYLILFAGTLDGLRPKWSTAVMAGVLAGLGCALKPRYAGVFVALEAAALVWGLRPWRAMPFAAAATMLAYGAAVAVICPAYLARAVPLALALYGGTDVTFTQLLLDSAMLIAGEVAVLLLWWRARRDLPERNLLLALMVFAAASTVICFVDGKDWFYHRLPATIVTVLGLLCWAVSTWLHRHSDSRSFRLPMAMAGIVVMIFSVAAFQRLEPQVALAVEPEVDTVARLEQIVRQQHARTYIAFSEWIALGFPVVNNTGVAWASRFDSMWALKGELWRARFDPAGTKEFPIRRWVAHDFIAGCPDIAVVDNREGTNYIGVLSASDPSFARAWSRYKQIAAFDGLTVYQRGKAGCIDPWVAAEARIPTVQ